MSRKQRETTEEERRIIINLFKSEYSHRYIGKIVNRSYSTIKNIINRFCERKTIKNSLRTGRPPVLTKREKLNIMIKVKKDPTISASKLAAELLNTSGKSVSLGTIRNYLHKQGYHARIARKKPFISKINKIKRLEYAKMYRNHPSEYWKRIIFSDESKFNIYRSDGKVRVWRLKNTELDEKNICTTVKHGKSSLLVWGCMSANGVGNLHVFEGIMNHRDYINILKQNLHASANKMGILNNFIFTQDNDPKHTALNTKMWLLYNTPKWIETPPQSPDINPIEHLWNLLEQKIRQRNITSKNTLKDALLEEWNSISADITENLVNSMPRRLESIIQNKGGHTKY